MRVEIGREVKLERAGRYIQGGAGRKLPLIEPGHEVREEQIGRTPTPAARDFLRRKLGRPHFS